MAAKRTNDRKSRKRFAKGHQPGKKRAVAKAVSSKKRLPSGFPIVGVGASAGGLEALERFLGNMPSDSGMAFVLVTHLAPSHVSMLPDLLKRHTKIEVVQAEDGMKVKPNRVHIIPPNTDMAIMKGALLLSPPLEARGLRLPVDHFFRSLAEDQRERAICVILSGNGTDGTLGLKAIKAECGMAMVQEPNSAKYDGMPRSAIDTGLVDYILPPEKMPQQLILYATHAGGPPKVPAVVSDALPASLQKIFVMLRSQTGHDFAHYKRNTICRRIERRMHVHQIENINDYLRYLQQTPREADILFKELLIGVTSFFRDPEAFKVLKQHLLKALKERPKDHVLRIWVPGCSGGEEVYSLAILLQECMAELNRTFKVQIFGTDLDNDAIQTARAGLYPASIAGDMSPQRLKRYFMKEEDNTYRISKDIREMVVFAFQNVIKDPPFTKIDLLSCRNLLIYLDADLQRRLLPIFHYALRPNGLLFLGTSESVGSFLDLFSLLDKKWKIFKRKESSFSAEAIVGFPSEAVKPPVPEAEARKEQKIKIVSVAEQLLLERYAPPCVLINQEGNILYTHGRTGKYLELAQGQARLKVVEMAREGLKHELAAGIRKATATQSGLSLQNLQVKTDGGVQRINVSLKPVRGGPAGEPLLLILFEQQENPKPLPSKTQGRAKQDSRVAVLEQDLRSSRESLQTTIEELETSNEELRSTNEELQSTNEELQSTNEELETSKEEMQSLNEELVTVNTELQGKIDELSMASSDLKNLLDSTKIGTIFLDGQLHLKRFTPEAKRVVNLIPSDVGRPLGDISLNMEDVDLVDDAQKVLDTLVFREREVKTKDGQYFLMRMMPYRTSERVIDGVVMTFTNLTEHKQLEGQLRDEGKQYQLLFELNPEPSWIFDRESLAFLAVNEAALTQYQYPREEFLEMTLRDVSPEKELPTFLNYWDKAKKRRGDGVASVVTKHRRRDGKPFDAQVDWRPITFNGKAAILAVTTEVDRTRERSGASDKAVVSGE